MDGDRIAEAGKRAVQPPRPAAGAIHLRVERDLAAHLHHLLSAEPTAEFAGPAGIRTQRITLDQHRIFGFNLLARAVMGVAVIDGDRGIDAVAVVLGAPAAADQPAEINVEAVVARPAAVDAAEHEISMMAGNDAIRNGRRQRLEDSVDDRHRKRHPHPHRRRLLRADHASRRQHDVERAELPVIDRQIERRCQALERDRGTTSAPRFRRNCRNPRPAATLRKDRPSCDRPRLPL